MTKEGKCEKCGGVVKDEGKKQICLSCGQVNYVLKAEPGRMGVKFTKPK